MVGLSEKKTELNSISGVFITGNHPYTFRSGKSALITGVKRIMDMSEKRICYEITFPDGFVDYVPLSDIGNYRMWVE